MTKNYVICSPDVPQSMCDKLISFDWIVVTVPKHPALLEPIQGHPDLQLFAITNQTVIVHPDSPDFFIKKIKSIFQTVIKGESHLSRKYPRDIYYNAKIAGGIFFHTLDYTDPVLKQTIDGRNIESVNVSQGYTGCSILKIADNAIITSDKNICENAIKKSIDVLRINSGNIELPGMNHGFIGGTGGWDGLNTVYFCGDIATHPDNKKIIDFIEKHRKKICCLDNRKLLDLGSLIFINPYLKKD